MTDLRIYATDQDGEREEITDLYWFEENFIRHFNDPGNAGYSFELVLNGAVIFRSDRTDAGCPLTGGEQ